MKRTALRVIVGAGMALLLAGAISLAHAQAPPAGMRLYAFSSGALTVPKNFLQAGAPATSIQVPVGFYVVRHPKGNVLFDTGNNDRIITDPSYWGAFIQGLNPVRTPDVAIDAQLAKIGLKPDDIKYVVIGHMHLDHGGNVGKFTKSTIVLQKDEIKNAFWGEPGTPQNYIPSDFMMLRNDPGQMLPNKYPMIQLNGDLDLFADNSVVVKRWVGHTPGSQMMVVRLPKTGTVILTSDSVYFAENVTKNLLPDVSLAYDPGGIFSAYQYIREMQAREGAQFFTAHDPDAWKAMKKAPDFLE
jgi:N-acyl homoserine lactone hydrolase